MLAPHHAENAQFGKRWLAAKQTQYFLIFGRAELMCGDHFWRDPVFLHALEAATPACNTDSRMVSPSVPPIKRICRPLRMRHQSHNVALTIQDARNVPHRPIRILPIPKNYSVFRFQLIEHILVRYVAAFAVRYR